MLGWDGDDRTGVADDGSAGPKSGYQCGLSGAPGAGGVEGMNSGGVLGCCAW